jgi:3-phenylpropionate/cinnamic acid dioxygenase small subunit
MSASTDVTHAAEVVPVPLGPDAEIQREIEQFLFLEAELLDDRRFRDWLNLLADDLHYFMPTRANRTLRELKYETSTPGEVPSFEDDKVSMGWRVSQFETGMHWAEDPPSRTRHLVTNVRVKTTEADDEFAVRSNFLCYRNRLDTEVDIWAGERQDIVRRIGDRRWQIARRYILLDQNVILSKNLSVFF